MTGAPAPLQRLVLAVDGPSGSGKSSVSRRVARVLGLGVLDTGAMYRAVTCAALDRGLDLADADAVAALARAAQLEQSLDPERESVVIDGTDVTTAIREPRVSAAVSAVATNLAVREELVARQRAVAASGGVVIEGRDITTVVAPDAPVRILLTADEGARVARRARELHGTADAQALAATQDLVVLRDARDSTVAAFTTAAEGVVEIDTSALGFDEVVQAVLDVVVARVPEAAAVLHPAEAAR
ncbi:(d)CMP kinase [Motilibacter rhizosphaerae]|uniref:(d)CMP kinase n=1 Tax=Motilibacter rhizosphaerae TaxID=598652 RepID=UPI00102BB853|nr:(d)CMP kinase [Motilibacter rhizosphaerae]